MNKFKQLTMVLVLALLLSSIMVVPGFAASEEVKELSLISEDSGYSILIPNFVEVKTVEYDIDGETFNTTVVVIETPQKDSNGTYPIFEVVTSDNSALSLQSFPGFLTEGQAGSFEGNFENGRLMYSPTFYTKQDLKDISKDKIYVFDFFVYDKESNLVFSVKDLNFMFVDNGAVNNIEMEQKVVSAVPTSSKVVVNGKQVAFEAYNIEGNNYFKLRDLAMAVNGTEKQFEVGWDGANNAINLTTEKAYTSRGDELSVSSNPTTKEGKSTSSKMYINGVEVQFVAYNIDNSNYFKLRDIAKAIDFGVTWDGSLNMVGIDTSVGY